MNNNMGISRMGKSKIGGEDPYGNNNNNFGDPFNNNNNFEEPFNDNNIGNNQYANNNIWKKEFNFLEILINNVL